jgi:hypothetical protein
VNGLERMNRERGVKLILSYCLVLEFRTDGTMVGWKRLEVNNNTNIFFREQRALNTMRM